MLDAVNLYLAGRGIRITTGTIVDATIIHAPSSTKNEKKEHDPEMHQTRKSNQWYLAACGAIGHFPVGMPANGNEMTFMPRSVGGAKVEVVRVLVLEKVDEALTRA